MTNDQIGWVVEVSVNAGRLAPWNDLMHEMVASTRAEPGTLTYEWMLGADGSRCQIFERYASVAAALIHARAFDAKFAKRFLALASPKALSVYGTPDAELRAWFAPSSPRYFSPIGGFDRTKG